MYIFVLKFFEKVLNFINDGLYIICVCERISIRRVIDGRIFFLLQATRHQRIWSFLIYERARRVLDNTSNSQPSKS